MTACGVSLSVTIFMAITALLLPRYYKWRDDRAFTLPVYDLEALGACEGYFQVNHSPATLHRLQKTTPNPNIQPVGNVKLYYITTKCNATESSNSDDTNNNNNNNNSSHNNKPHVVLLHGTGLSSKVFTDKPNPDSDDDSDDGTLTLWKHLQDMDYEVTAIDMRGHGRSEITDGPYSIELLGADVAQLLRSMTTTTTAKAGNTNNKFHCYGFSAGFGACMSLAAYHTDIIASLSGSGFLMDRSRKDLMAYIFSREPVVRFLGTRVVSKMGKMVFKSPARYNVLSTWMKHCHMDGFAHFSSSWLMFNITKDIPYNFIFATRIR